MQGIYIPHPLWYAIFLMILMIKHGVLPRFSLTSWRKMPQWNQKLSRSLKYRIWTLNFVRLCIEGICFEINIKKGLVEWDVYRIQRNITTSIYKKSQATYFSERCEGGAKNQPFLTSKQPSSQDIILKEDDKIITDEREICDIFNDFFLSCGHGYWFKNDIPDDFKTADGFAKIIDKHSNHPSIIKIYKRCIIFISLQRTTNTWRNLCKEWTPKKPKATIIYQANCYVLALQVFALMYLN